MAIKRKKLTKKQLKMKKTLYKNIFITVLLCLLVIILSYVILKTDILTPRIDEVTTSYISFNNKNTTDMLKISNLKRMNDTIGQSIINNSKVDFKITGEKNYNYQIILYPITNNVDEKFIRYSFSINKKTKVDNLSNIKDSLDGGKILYEGKLNTRTKISINMWISKDYKKKNNNTSYEVKVIPRSD